MSDDKLVTEVFLVFLGLVFLFVGGFLCFALYQLTCCILRYIWGMFLSIENFATGLLPLICIVLNLLVIMIGFHEGWLFVGIVAALMVFSAIVHKQCPSCYEFWGLEEISRKYKGKITSSSGSRDEGNYSETTSDVYDISYECCFCKKRLTRRE